jgi:hypothetical protein
LVEKIGNDEHEAAAKVPHHAPQQCDDLLVASESACPFEHGEKDAAISLLRFFGDEGDALAAGEDCFVSHAIKLMYTINNLRLITTATSKQVRIA